MARLSFKRGITVLRFLSVNGLRWNTCRSFNHFPYIQIEEKEVGKSPEGPKHGITDPTGAPHVGGGTFAGGVGKFILTTDQSLYSRY